MKIPTGRILIICAPLLFTACATIGPPLPPSLDLPKPPSDLKAARKGNRVTLTWTIPTITTDRQTTRSLGPTRICRDLVELKDCGIPIGKTASHLNPPKSTTRPEGTFVDTLSAEMLSDNPTAFVFYAVEAPNSEGRAAGISNQARVPLARTLAPPRDFQARVTSQGVVLNWKAEVPPENSNGGAHYVVRVIRRPIDGQQQTVVGEQPIAGDQTLTDSAFEWEKSYRYHAETVAILDSGNKDRGTQSPIQVEGDDTPEITVFADDVFPPSVPAGLQAVFSGPGQKPFIDLVWAPVTDADLAGYNVYRHEEGASPAKINAELLKTPSYRDSDVSSGKKYFYSVSSVDLRGNESAPSEEASESVP